MIRRLISRTCICHSSRVRFWCLLALAALGFAICRCSGGSVGGAIAFQWILVVSVLIVDWGACGGPPVCDVGAVGAGPCGILSADPEGWPCSTPFSFISWSIEDGVFFTAFLGWWLLLLLLGRHVAYLGWYESPLNMFVCDGFIWVIWSVTSRFVVSLIEICCFIVCLWSSSFSWCWCQSSTFYATVCRCLWILDLKCDQVLFCSKWTPCHSVWEDLSREKEPDLFMWGCLLSPCIITCISLLIELTSSFAVWMIWFSIFLLQIITVGEVSWNRN